MAETVFITRYALTDGILEREALKIEDDGKYVRVRLSSGGDLGFWGKDWHRTREEADADAERRRVAKIESHRKSIAKLERMAIRFSGLPKDPA